MGRRRIWRHGCVLAALAGLLNLGSAVLAAPARPATPVAAVSLLVNGHLAACTDPAGWSPAKGCPITVRLQRRLRQHPTEGRGGGADPICRCQNTAPIRITLHDAKGKVAHVNVRWAFQPPLTITFTAVRQGKIWLVDDTYCAGKPSTSIYKSPVKSC